MVKGQMRKILPAHHVISMHNKSMTNNRLPYVTMLRRPYITILTRTKEMWQKQNRCSVPSSPDSSFVFARWQHKTEGLAAIRNCTFWLGVWPPNLPFPSGVRDPIQNLPFPLGFSNPHLTQCVPAKWHLNLSNSWNRRHKCDITPSKKRTSLTVIIKISNYNFEWNGGK